MVPAQPNPPLLLGFEAVRLNRPRFLHLTVHGPGTLKLRYNQNSFPEGESMLTKFTTSTATGLLLLLLGILPNAAAQSAANSVSLNQLKYVGTASLSNASPAAVNSATQFRIAPLPKRPTGFAPTLSLLHAPKVPVNKVVGGGASANFPGITTVDSANVNSGFVITPPDQGLCVGNGYVVEAVNLALSVYNKSGKLLMGPTALNTFIPSDFFSTFFSDPKCYFDIPTKRWFVSITNVVDFNTGRSNFFLAVSQTSDPRGSYFIYSVDTTDDGMLGTPSHPGCPCFGDQPLLGADKNGIYISTNEFNIFGSVNVFNGAQIYAMSKTLLEQGILPTVVHFNLIGNSLAEGTAASVQPATAPNFNDSDEDSGRRGTGVEYFLSSLDFTGTLDNRIAVWAMSNTISLTQTAPSLSLVHVVIHSEVYGVPPDATQKAGPNPLGAAQDPPQPEEILSTGDDRMQQVVFANGQLWSGLTTIVADGTNANAAIAYFVVRPKLKEGVLTAKIQGQNYVSVKGSSVMYPAIGVTADGKATIAFSLSGPRYFPSAAFARVNPVQPGDVHIVAAGGAPQDDLSGYPQFGGNGSARWGDYSAAVADGDSIWLAAEYIPGNIDSAAFLTNWGTFIYRVRPED